MTALGWAGSGPVGSNARCRGCQILEPLPGPAPGQLLVLAAQSCSVSQCTETCSFPSHPAKFVSFSPKAREQIVFPSGSCCHIGGNLEMLLLLSLSQAVHPDASLAAEFCPRTCGAGQGFGP